MFRRIFSLIKILIILAFLGTALVVLLGIWYAKDLPDPEKVLSKGFAESTKIYDRTGNTLLYQVGQERRTVIKLEELPPHVRWATLVAEDSDFYTHPGIDVPGIIRAAIKDVQTRSLEQGGSTITQQLVKNALLSPEKTFSRKFREIVLAIWLETKYSKDEILSFYLNQIPYGQNAFGIEQASRTYFGKSARDITVPEAAILASLPLRPSYLSPYGEHKDELLARKDFLIGRMVQEGYITGSQAVDARNEEIVFSEALIDSFPAPHFVIYVKEYLEEKYGAQVVEKGGLRVTTTLDSRIQQKAEEVIKEVVPKNEKTFNANNASLVALDPKTGQILAMVGSRDWFNDEIDGKVNVALRLRQPGSAFKPIAYSKLFEQGFSPESLIFDLPTTFTTRAGKGYTPINFDGKNSGLITLRQALAGSINVTAVKVLHLAGIDNVIELAQKLGISSINPSRVDLALVLGGAEVRLLDITNAYATLANDGTHNKTAMILRVVNNKGEVLEEFKSDPKKVLEPKIARLTTSILSDNEARASVFGPNSPLHIPGLITAAKTGTTSDFRDGWAIGYTPKIAIGVWAGNNDNTPTRKGIGASIAGPIWNQVMRFSVSTYPKEFGGSFPAPLDHEIQKIPMVNGSSVFQREVVVDKLTGTLATQSTPPSLRETRLYQEVHSLLYYVAPSDPQVEAWELPIRKWLQQQEYSHLYNRPLPLEKTNTSSTPTTGGKPTLTILGISDGQQIGTFSNINFTFQGNLPLKQVDVFVDNLLIETASKAPISINLSSFSEGEHELVIRAFDQALNSDTKTLSIILNKSIN